MDPTQSTNAESRSSTHTIHLPAIPALPRQILTTGEAVSTWPSTPGFQAFWGWIKRRCQRIKGKEIYVGSYEGVSEAVKILMSMLESMMLWAEEVPLKPLSNQRFGNLAFRDYIKLVEERLPTILSTPPLQPHLPAQLLPLFLNSSAFGQGTRLDYGTGHELAFVLGLWCCVASSWVDGEEDEDELVLRVFPKYLELVTLLQTRFRLEPAGSHGVWGLDDYCFFPYLFGAAQLLDSPTTPSLALAQAISPSPVKPITNLYTLSLHRITLFKSGASFSEHSPLLYQLSQFPNWQKPFGGLQKMFLGEVVGKRVVVQGLWIGGWCWGVEMPLEKEREGRGEDERRTGMRSGTGMVMGTGMGMEVTGVPWKTGRDGRDEVLARANAGWGVGTKR